MGMEFCSREFNIIRDALELYMQARKLIVLCDEKYDSQVAYYDDEVDELHDRIDKSIFPSLEKDTASLAKEKP